MHVQYGSISTYQDGDASQTHRVYNVRIVTRLPNYWASPKEKNQFSSSLNTKSTAEFKPLIQLHLCIFHDCMFLFCNAKFHPAVHGKLSVVVALLMKHIAFFFWLIRTPRVFFFCSSISFVCVIWICLTVLTSQCLTINECIQNLHWRAVDQLRINNLEV